MRGQSMSFDAIAATFLFILVAVFGVIYASNLFTGNTADTLRNEANAVSEFLIDELSVEAEGTGQTVIDERRFIRFIDRSNDEYSTIKSEIGVTKDFCVFLENETGGLVSIVTRDDSGDVIARRAAFGSSEVVFKNETIGTSTPFPCGRT